MLPRARGDVPDCSVPDQTHSDSSVCAFLDDGVPDLCVAYERRQSAQANPRSMSYSSSKKATGPLSLLEADTAMPACDYQYVTFRGVLPFARALKKRLDL